GGRDGLALQCAPRRAGRARVAGRGGLADPVDPGFLPVHRPPRSHARSGVRRQRVVPAPRGRTPAECRRHAETPSVPPASQRRGRDHAKNIARPRLRGHGGAPRGTRDRYHGPGGGQEGPHARRQGHRRDRRQRRGQPAARRGSRQGRRGGAEVTMRTIVVILIALVTPVLAADVTYFPAEKVSAAFAKGAVLFDGDGRNYMVHASRRDGAGQAEVHVKDTDIIYMLDGSA